MPKVKVALFKTSPARAVVIDTDATRGAVLGVDLYNKDGTLTDLDALVAAAIADQNDNGQGQDLTTDDVYEGRSNLYYTATRFWNALKAALVAGTNITLTPDDTAQTITIAATGGINALQTDLDDYLLTDTYDFLLVA